MYKVISLFSGAGGSSTGYKLAGYDVVASVEFIKHQAANYRLNYPNTKVYEQDIRTIDPLQVLKDTNIQVGELDVLDGSPPCSSFSTAGKVSKGWNEEKKYSNKKQRTDDLFYEYIRFLTAMKPKVFVAENVKGLTIGASKGMFKIFFTALSECGYNVSAKVLNSSYYSVPQSRERLIFVGVRNDINIEPSFPKQHEKIITIREAWKALPKDNDVQSNQLIEEAATKDYGWLHYLKLIPKNQKRIIKGSRVHVNGSYFNLSRLSYNCPSDTICQQNGQQGMSGNCHPEHDRKLTIHEVKRICTFPDDYKLEGTFEQQWEALGRAVPPMLMKAISEHVKTNILDNIK